MCFKVWTNRKSFWVKVGWSFSQIHVAIRPNPVYLFFFQIISLILLFHPFLQLLLFLLGPWLVTTLYRTADCENEVCSSP